MEDDQPAPPTRPWQQSPKACALPRLGELRHRASWPCPEDHLPGPWSGWEGWAEVRIEAIRESGEEAPTQRGTRSPQFSSPLRCEGGRESSKKQTVGSG